MIASGGDLKAGIISALTAGTFEYVGGLDFVKSVGDVAFAAKAVAHGVVGGVSSVAQGGKFLAGFASAGVAQTIGGSKFVRGLTKAGQGIARVVAGGLASVAGGKFKNGAVTAAFAYAFNELRHQYEFNKLENAQKANGNPTEVRYNKPPPDTVPIMGDTAYALQCLADCTPGSTLTVKWGARAV